MLLAWLKTVTLIFTLFNSYYIHTYWATDLHAASCGFTHRYFAWVRLLDFTAGVSVWIMACMGSHSVMLTCINVRADVLQWLSAELYVSLLLIHPLMPLLFRGLIGYMQIQGNFKRRVEGFKCINGLGVRKWECKHTVTRIQYAH